MLRVKSAGANRSSLYFNCDMVPEEFRGTKEPEFSYVVNYSDWERGQVEVIIRARSFWFISTQSNYISLTLQDKYTVASFIH